MLILRVRFETSLSEDEVMAVAKERADQFRAIPGLIQKSYVRLQEPNHYGGVYIWESMESLQAYRQSALAASIPEAYRVIGEPEIEVMDVLFQLRE